MPQKLSMWQTNMLITGKSLAAEIPAPSENGRTFLYICSYCDGPDKRKQPSIFLNGDHSDVRFRVRVFEVANEHINTWHNSLDTDYYEREVSKHDGIATVDDLEHVLRAYMDDFSPLGSQLKVEVPHRPANDEATWIEQARAGLQLDAGQFRRLTGHEALLVVQLAENTFVSQHNRVWRWEHFRCRHYVAWLKEPNFKLLPLLAPSDGKSVWLIITDARGAPLVYEGTAEACSAVIAECPPFEFNIVGRDCTWLLCENHHDALFVVGFRAMRRLKQVVRQHPDLLGAIHVGGRH